ncbi:magnesium transporter CorA family protein [Patescibacteria group bacterium]|nr:magnesium transporter CorA family protein [Patescibacteria group bacterium]
MKIIIEKGLRWIDVEHPSKADIEKLHGEFPTFHPLTLEDTLSPIQRPKVDVFSDHLFIVLHFPVYEKKSGRITSAEVDVFVGKGFIVTLHDGRLKPLVDFFDEVQDNEKTRREAFLKGSAGYLLYIVLNKILDATFPILYRIDTELDIIEDKIFERERISKQIEALSDQRRNILAYRRIISPQRSILPLVRDRLSLVGIREQMAVYFNDLVDHIEKMWQTLEEQKEVAEGLHDSTAALVNTLTNDVVRVLTVITVVFLPLTLIASVFGMNVPLPLEKDPVALPVILLIMLVILTGLTLLFRKFLKWL